LSNQERIKSSVITSNSRDNYNPSNPSLFLSDERYEDDSQSIMANKCGWVTIRTAIKTFLSSVQNTGRNIWGQSVSKTYLSMILRQIFVHLVLHISCTWHSDVGWGNSYLSWQFCSFSRPVVWLNDLWWYID